jgi:hypothetical protein
VFVSPDTVAMSQDGLEVCFEVVTVVNALMASVAVYSG